MNFEYKVEGTKGSGQTGACNLIINAVLCYFFWTYWQNNPDQGACWASQTTTTPSATAQPGYTDVSAQFVTWFKWGFIINVVAIVLAVVQFIHAATDNPPGDDFSRYGDSNGIVVLKPCQGAPIDLKRYPNNHENRRGMKDVHGQMTPEYATQKGTQMEPIGKMLKKLLGVSEDASILV